MGFFKSLFVRTKTWLTWTWTYLWLLWVILIIILYYILKGPLKLSDKVPTGKYSEKIFSFIYFFNSFLYSSNEATMFFNTLSPKFYVALTGTSSLISGIILVSGQKLHFKNHNVLIMSFE